METIKKKSKGYFTTGEFAKLCNVKKQTLFHYDAIGILSPEILAQNGYRYYSYRQLEIFSVISMLKEMNMPLKEIKQYLDHRSPKAFLSLMTEQLHAIEQKITELTALKEYVKSKLTITTEAVHAETETVLFCNQPEEYLIMTEYKGSGSARDIAAATVKNRNYYSSLGMYSAASLGGTISSSALPLGEEYTYSHLYARITGDISRIRSLTEIFVKPAGLYAVLYHKGGYSTAAASYQRLADAVSAHGFSMGPFFYEDDVLDELAMEGYDNYMIKIAVPVFEKTAQNKKEDNL